jgi:hypothetical protein
MSETAGAKASRFKPPLDQALAGPGLRSNIDILLAAAGVAIALSSMAFAGYMVADADRPPRIAGMEYLSVFAKPNHSLSADAQAAPPPSVQAAINLAAQAIDPTPTGSIPEKGAIGPSVNLIVAPMRGIDLRPSSSPYKLLDVANGEALVQSDVGFRHVRAGDTLPEYGRINAIEKRGDHWVMLTQNGAPLEWPAPSALTPRSRK